MSESDKAKDRNAQIIIAIIQAVSAIIVAYIEYKAATYSPPAQETPAQEFVTQSPAFSFNIWQLIALAFFIILLVARRRAFVIANTRKGNYIVLMSLRTPPRDLTEKEMKFIARLEDLWWKNWYWLIVGGRALKQP
jgi:hypothetical protein